MSPQKSGPSPACARRRPTLERLLPRARESVLATLPPRALLHPARFDTVTKYVYAKYRATGIQSDWHARQFLAPRYALARGRLLAFQGRYWLTRLRQAEWGAASGGQR